MIRAQDAYPPAGGRQFDSAPRYYIKAAKAAFSFFSMFTVYVLYSPSFKKIYIGYTSDLANRLDSHNIFAKKGYTVKFRPWELVYSEEYNTKTEAVRREKQLKSAKGREFIWNDIIDKIDGGLDD